MLQVRMTGMNPRRAGNRRKKMERISRALGFAVALGTGGLMFALTLV
jgi:hypothetical protein